MLHRFVHSFVAAVCLMGCSSAEEPARVDLQVVVDASSVEPVTTDLGYEVELTEARIAVKDFTFATAGEEHTASLIHEAYDWLVPSAFAHPGHDQEGEVTGEMQGSFILDWLPGGEMVVGDATLIVGSYRSANFYLARATEDQLGTSDLLVGHTAILRGTASKGDGEVSFVALVDSPEDEQIIGVPSSFEVTESTDASLQLRFKTQDDLEGDTIFDGLEFSELGDDSEAEIVIAPDADSENLEKAYNLLRRALQTHDHFEVVAATLN